MKGSSVLTEAEKKERLTKLNTITWDLASMHGYALDCASMMRQAALLSRYEDKAQELREMAQEAEKLAQMGVPLLKRFREFFPLQIPKEVQS
jgi:hypothetical protein